MIDFNHIFKNDYDKRIKIGGEYVFCYSKKKMQMLYPENNFSVVGEISTKLPKEEEVKEEQPNADIPDETVETEKIESEILEEGTESEPEKLEKEVIPKIGVIPISGNQIDVFDVGKYQKFPYKTAGYLCVGNDKFITIHSNLIPFISIISGIAALIIATIAIIIILLNNPEPPAVIEPENPMPEVDPNIEHIEGETVQKETASKGNGSISMIYSKVANVSLYANKATIMFKNPNSSNHDIVLKLYIVSDGNEYFVGQTGRIPAGSAIYDLDVSNREVEIRAGTYKGLYRMVYYNPLTGESASVGANITDVTVKVTE